MDVAQLTNDEKVIMGRLFIWQQTGMGKSEGRKKLAKRKIEKRKKRKAANKVGKSCTWYSGVIC